jgi:dimethylamine monooxygenase subunit A
MLPYFPFRKNFDLSMGTSVLPAERGVIEVDFDYASELALKEQALTTDHGYYFCEQIASRQAQAEAVNHIATDASRLYPHQFSYHPDTKQFSVNGKVHSCPSEMAPLDWIGRFFQEDFLLLDEQGILRAGQLCFPSGWSVGDKINKPFLSIHEPLPSVMNPMLQAAHKFMQMLKMGKPMERTNWGFRLTHQLDLSMRYSQWYREEIDRVMQQWSLESIGKFVWVRVEHQTLSRLPGGYVLFTIHTFQSRLESESVERKKIMFDFLKTVPPSLIQYKVMDRFYAPLLEYLKNS